MKYQTQALSKLRVKIEMAELKQRQYTATITSQTQTGANTNRETLARLKEDRFWLSKGRQKYFAEQQEGQEALDRYDRRKYFFNTLVLGLEMGLWQKYWPELKIQLEKDNELLIKKLSVIRKLGACMK